MIENITEGQAKDMILEYCLKNKGLNSGTQIRKVLFPEDSIDLINLLIEKISYSADPIANVRLNGRTKYISSNGITPVFLKQGGYTQSEKNEQLEVEKEQIREYKKDEILDLELKLKTFESKIGKKIIVAGFIITFLSFLITALTLEFWQTDESKNEQKNQVKNPLSNKKEEIQKDTLN